jgi:hypothetical protein
MRPVVAMNSSLEHRHHHHHVMRQSRQIMADWLHLNLESLDLSKIRIMVDLMLRQLRLRLLHLALAAE